MGDSGSDRASNWVSAGTSSNTVHILYQQAEEDEPSSSIPVSSSTEYRPASSASFVQSSYRTQPVYQSNERYTTNGYNVQGASVSGHIYQAAESSYPSGQDVQVQPDQYGDIVAVGNEAQMQMYNNINDNETSFAASQPVASSSVADGGYSVPHMLVDGMIVDTQENRVPVGLQRVISPDVDSTVSQSINSIPITHRHINENDNTRLRQTGTNGAMINMHLSQAQSEVSTSAESMSQVNLGHHHGDNEIRHRDIDGRHGEVEAGPSGIVVQGSRRNVDVMESAVSSITGSVSNEAEVTMRTPLKIDRRSLDDIVSGEPDTTQVDDDDEGEYEQDDLEENSEIDNRENELSSHMLPLDNQPHPSSSNNVVDSTQMMTSSLPVSNSVISTNQIPVSNLSANYMAVNISDYQDQMQAPPQSQMTANEIALGQIAANQLTASMESQLSQAAYILDTSTIDSNSKIQQSDLGLQLANFMNARGLRIDQNLEQPGTSTDSQFLNRRKSSRLACLDNEESNWKKPEYVSRPYDPNMLWCEECMRSYETECEEHKLSLHPDKVVFSRAWASLPAGLQIFKLQQDGNELGVFTKRAIPKRTQFGPFIADFIPDDRSDVSTFPLMVERQGSTLYFDTTDENKCNWMMFVRPAQTFAEQNLVAYQFENEIYFTVTKDITELRTELKVGYAAHYAERWNKTCLKATEEDIQALEEQMCKFHCYECPKRFRTAAALQKHLIAHDSDPLKSGTSEEPSSSQTMSPPKPRARKSLAPQHSFRRKFLASKKDAGGSDSSGNSSGGIYHWKKRSTNIYLNKTLKKYHKRHDAEMLRKSVVSNQHMLMKHDASSETGIGPLSDWECPSCDLAFSNITLLNLHSLSHSEESIEDTKLAYQLETLLGTNSIVDQVQINCPSCSQQFYNKQDLVNHVSEHGTPKSTAKFSTDYHSDIMSPASNRQHRCGVCLKTFTSIDRLAKHHQCHGDDSEKPFQCPECFKRFINNSAMSCHMKTHSSAKYYQCPICHLGFDQTSAMREHSLIHANSNGSFNCPHCDKVFVEFLVLKKHVRGFHTNRTFPCEQCDKVFPRADKLRLHMLRHSSVREFMCDTCGRQFKRKDKLKEHIKRMHSADREEKDRMKALRPHAKRFIPKVSPTEYHRFIYKCHLCLLGFKRRGMLVNHIAKRHPDLKPESVPELNLPILKTQRDYYCQYCDKVYKSSSKRKSHILKNHPGSELPQSARKKSNIDETPGIPNPTYSQTVGSITTMPHQCEHCHKQYASKAKLLQHQRKHHPELIPHLERMKRDLAVQQQGAETTTYVVESGGEASDTQAADLLTQAMSELSQSVEFRQMSGQPGEQAYLTTRIGQGTPTMVQIQTSGIHGTQTIELAHLSQALQHFAPPQGHLPIQVQVSSGITSQIQLPITTSQAGSTAPGTHILTVDPLPGTDNSQQQTVATTQAQQLNFLPISIASGTYIPKSWNGYTQYKTH